MDQGGCLTNHRVMQLAVVFIVYSINASAWVLNCTFCSSVRVRTSVPHASAGTAMPVCSVSTSALMKVSSSVSLARQLAVAAFPPAPLIATRLPLMQVSRSPEA